MRWLKEYAAARGHEVSGSDIRGNGHDAENVDGKDMAVYSAAACDCEEVREAKRRKIATVGRENFLSAIAAAHDTTIAVAGTHGKTTTTAMIGNLLLPMKPSVHAGVFPAIFSSEQVGEFQINAEEERLFITEACEYKRSFLCLKPNIAVILNARLDHTDCYADVQEVRDAFRLFAERSERIICYGDDEKLKCVMPGERSVWFGFGEDNDFFATDIVDGARGTKFVIKKPDGKETCVHIPMRGEHNVLNAVAAIAAANELGCTVAECAERFAYFLPPSRRQEFIGRIGEADVYTDYAHHPDEIRATIAAVRKGKTLVFFEPHTFTRTEALFDEFVEELGKADEVAVLPVYAARESGDESVAARLTAAINSVAHAVFLSGYESAKKFLKSKISDFDTVLFLGAGSIDSLARESLSYLE